MCARVCTYVNVCAYMCASVHARVHVCACMCVCMYKCFYKRYICGHISGKTMSRETLLPREVSKLLTQTNKQMARVEFHLQSEQCARRPVLRLGRPGSPGPPAVTTAVPHRGGGPRETRRPRRITLVSRAHTALRPLALRPERSSAPGSPPPGAGLGAPRPSRASTAAP